MKKLKTLFGGIKMTWTKVILLSVVTAVYTALINQVPALENTSFRDIAVYPECWLLFAIFIIVNCETALEASVKCFVFFLISQPLIYFIEVPFCGIGVFSYYKYWFIVTLLTFPGAAIAFQVKKKNWLSVAILSVAIGMTGAMFITYLNSVRFHFPYHLLSAIFCVILAIFLAVVLLDDRKHRVTAIAVFVLVCVISFAISGAGKPQELRVEEPLRGITVEDSTVVTAELVDENTVKLSPKHNGTTEIICTDQAGQTHEYYVTVGGGNMIVNSMEE